MSEVVEQAPGIGDWVHFVNGIRHVPALITDPAFPVFEADIAQALTVFPVGEPSFTTVAGEDTTGKPGTWHWPEHEGVAIGGFYELGGPAT